MADFYSNNRTLRDDFIKILGSEVEASRTVIVDTRSPIEAERGRIQGCHYVNIPLFTNEDRAKVGKTYKHQGREAAISVGLKCVSPLLKEGLLEKQLRDFLAKNKLSLDKTNIIIQCFRGGMRSRSVAWHLAAECGIDVTVLEGGYKGYRQRIHSMWESRGDFKVCVVGGRTGAGKTKSSRVHGRPGAPSHRP